MNGQPVLGKEGASGELALIYGTPRRPLSRPRRTREAVGHWPGQLQKDPHGEARGGCVSWRSTVPPREDGNACDDWMLDLSVARYTVCDRDLLEQNFGWNDTGDRRRVCVQRSADAWNCLRRAARVSFGQSSQAGQRLDGRCADVSVIAVWVLLSVEDGGCGEGP